MRSSGQHHVTRSDPRHRAVTDLDLCVPRERDRVLPPRGAVPAEHVARRRDATRCRSPIASASPHRARPRRRRTASSPAAPLTMCDLPSEPLYTRNTFGIAVRPVVAGALSARRHSRLRHLADDLGLVHGRRIDLEDLDVVRTVELVVHDPRRLQDAVALGEACARRDPRRRT